MLQRWIRIWGIRTRYADVSENLELSVVLLRHPSFQLHLHICRQTDRCPDFLSLQASLRQRCHSRKRGHKTAQMQILISTLCVMSWGPEALRSTHSASAAPRSQLGNQPYADSREDAPILEYFGGTPLLGEAKVPGQLRLEGATPFPNLGKAGRDTWLGGPRRHCRERGWEDNDQTRSRSKCMRREIKRV